MDMPPRLVLRICFHKRKSIRIAQLLLNYSRSWPFQSWIWNFENDFGIFQTHGIHVWYIYLHGWLICMVNVGKYTIVPWMVRESWISLGGIPPHSFQLRSWSPFGSGFLGLAYRQQKHTPVSGRSSWVGVVQLAVGKWIAFPNTLHLKIVFFPPKGRKGKPDRLPLISIF